MKRKFAFLGYWILQVIPAVLVAQSNLPLVAGKDVAIASTQSGQVRGYIHKGIFTFKGIPYAKVERFMAPQKPTPWSGIRSSMTYGPVCPMDPVTTVNDASEFVFNHDWGYTNEHCQVLNIWTPDLGDHKKRAVMVWFHGGGFTAGSSVELPSYDGENLSRTGDVVVVSVNHRLNILGFLDLSAYGEKYKGSPNAGLLDLVAALQWVKDNIAQFGGDPGNVTIFGQSGGGGKVTSLMCAPAAKGLFQRGIVESGSYLSKFTEQSVSRQVAAALLEQLQLQPQQVDSLEHISYERLNEAGKKALAKVTASLRAQGKSPGGFGLGWGPILDSAFLPFQPSDPAALALSKTIPLLVGSTKNEFYGFLPGSSDPTMDTVKSMLLKKYGDKTDAYLAAVMKAYPETSQPSDYISIDFMFRAAAINQANLKVAAGGAPVYMYLFTWQSPVLDGSFKAKHCIELPFVFNNIARCEEMTGGGPQAYALATKVSAAWVNFAKTGNPNAKGLPNWPQYKPEDGAVMIFDNRCEVKHHPDQDLLAIAAGK
jgi:para-nitrobenzyl esterase